MSNRKDRPISGHDYDGIQELDNPLPKWWLATFYGTILFSIIYWGYYELGRGPSSSEALATRMAAINSSYAVAEEAAMEAAENVDVDALTSDPELLAAGAKGFAEKCAVCHGDAGEGNIGPNLTDKYWVHSQGDMPGIVKAIRDGFPTKGMPPWAALMSAEEQSQIAAYVISIEGTDPPNAKEPQGELVE